MKKMHRPDEVHTTHAKKKYSTPRVACFGNVTLITRGGNGKGLDSGLGGGAQTQTRMCWIAEVLYGADAPRTLLVRAWLTEAYERRDPMARIVVPLYSRFGVSVAHLLRKRPLLQPLFRPLFDRAVKCAHGEYAGRALHIA